MVLVDFRVLHLRHNGCMFSMLSVPPFEMGIMWSRVNVISGSDLEHDGQDQLN
jgi:hypothetical protein